MKPAPVPGPDKAMELPRKCSGRGGPKRKNRLVQDLLLKTSNEAFKKGQPLNCPAAP
jgi:hypothetical protein